MSEKILIVDDEDDIRMLIQGLLEDEGYTVLTAAKADQAYEIIEKHAPQLVVQDIWLQGSDDDGVDILKNVKETHPEIAFIMISGHGTIETAVSSIQSGAYDFIEKPFKSDRLLLMVERALENIRLKQQNEDLRVRAAQNVAQFAKALPDAIRQMLEKTAKTNSRLFITGEIGTGKGTAAHFIHENSSRAHRPFMTLNCANPSAQSLTKELFGDDNTLGLVALAEGGTILLDDITSMPLELQGKVLMLLQENAYFKHGTNIKIPSDIRFIATSAENPQDKISEGTFREDLYYRLNVVPIDIPPLRKRKTDIAQIVSSQCDIEFSNSAMTRLSNYSWPGNIKQLHNVIEWLSIMYEPSKTIEPADLPAELGGKTPSNDAANDTMQIDDLLDMPLRDARERFEREYLLSQVQRFDGNISKTAEFIGMERSALHRKLKSLDVLSENKQNVA